MDKKLTRLVKSALITCCFVMVSAAEVFAQPPVDAGTLIRQEERARQSPQPILPETSPRQSQPELKAIDSTTILIKAVRFAGATELLEGKAINKRVKDFVLKAVDEKLDFDGLQALTDHITLLLKQDGWILARAYLPQQDVSNGVITISILRGQLDSKSDPIVLDPVSGSALRIDSDFLKGIGYEYLTPGQAVHEDELERALLLMNDLPGLDIRARLEAGQEPESTRVHLLVNEGDLLTGMVQADNFGNRFTGNTEVSSEVVFNDISGRGDRFSTSTIVSEGVRLGRLNYGFPIGYQGWYAGLSFTDLHYDVIEGQAANQADYEGTGRTFEATLRYPLLRSRQKNIWLGLGVRTDHFKDRFNKSLIADKRLNFGRVGLRGDVIDHWQGGGRSNWSFDWISGNLDLSRLLQQQQNDDNSFKSSGQFDKLEYTLSRHQYIDESLSLYLEFSGQLASSNLDSSQKFFPAGPNGVRAYPGSEAAADEGQLLRAELRYNVGGVFENLGNLRLNFFYDQAWVQLSDSHPSGISISNAAGANRYHIAGAGVGMRLVKDERYGVSLNLARKIGSNPGRDANTGFDSDERDNLYSVSMQGVLWF